MTAEYDDYKKILKEADLSEEAGELSQLLKELSTEPHRYGRVEPPAGYENHLIAALKMRLPLETKKKIEELPPERATLWSFFSSGRVAWSFSGAMAIFVAVLAFQSIKNVETPASPDFLTQTAQKGNSEAVERWVASVADVGVQTMDTHQGALVDELSKAAPGDANRALDSVEKSLGMNHDGI
ncbi:MAG: hypothetical protein ABIR96_09000 [Bdellovibrionota bacterium]